ncbi:hypothetical protein [Rhabdaerophilum sp. SD176]|nr:hypothetical protein [Rhabdaerophilum sp. SD176]
MSPVAQECIADNDLDRLAARDQLDMTAPGIDKRAAARSRSLFMGQARG